MISGRALPPRALAEGRLSLAPESLPGPAMTMAAGAMCTGMIQVSMEGVQGAHERPGYVFGSPREFAARLRLTLCPPHDSDCQGSETNKTDLALGMKACLLSKAPSLDSK